MSPAHDYPSRGLNHDIEGYFRCHVSQPIKLELAPRLDSWRLDFVYGRTETPSLFVLKETMLLRGHVTAHPEHADGELIEIASLVWLDRYAKWARTRDRLYRLGRRSDVSESQEHVE
jgi:hypothetical protein